MPESSKRKTSSKKPAQEKLVGSKKSLEAKKEELKKVEEKKEKKAEVALKKHSPRWYAPLMVTLMIIGLIFMIVAYIFGGAYPIPDAGNVNLFVGGGILLAGFLMTIGWK